MGTIQCVLLSAAHPYQNRAATIKSPLGSVSHTGSRSSGTVLPFSASFFLMMMSAMTPNSIVPSNMPTPVGTYDRPMVPVPKPYCWAKTKVKVLNMRYSTP